MSATICSTIPFTDSICFLSIRSKPCKNSCGQYAISSIRNVLEGAKIYCICTISRFNVNHPFWNINTIRCSINDLDGQGNQYNYGLSTDEQLSHQHNNNDDVYEKFLLNEAEQIFNERVEEAIQVFPFAIMSNISF